MQYELIDTYEWDVYYVIGKDVVNVCRGYAKSIRVIAKDVGSANEVACSVISELVEKHRKTHEQSQKSCENKVPFDDRWFIEQLFCKRAVYAAGTKMI